MFGARGAQWVSALRWRSLWNCNSTSRVLIPSALLDSERQVQNLNLRTPQSTFTSFGGSAIFWAWARVAKGIRPHLSEVLIKGSNPFAGSIFVLCFRRFMLTEITDIGYTKAAKVWHLGSESLVHKEDGVLEAPSSFF